MTCTVSAPMIDAGETGVRVDRLNDKVAITQIEQGAAVRADGRASSGVAVVIVGQAGWLVLKLD